jgi:hypothetical protein
MGGGGSSTTKSMEQTQSHKTEVEDSNKQEAARLAPWAPVAQDMTAIAGAGRDLYNSNPSGLGQMSSSAIGGVGAMSDAIASGGLGLASTDVARNTLIGQLRDSTLRKRADEIYKTNSASENNLQDTATGKYLSGANPYMDELIQRSQRDAANQVAAKFAASGRYGSGNFSTAIADTTGRIATEARMQDYEQERARQMQANQQIDAARMARLGLSGNYYQSYNQNRQGLIAQGAGDRPAALDRSLRALSRQAGGWADPG